MPEVPPPNPRSPNRFRWLVILASVVALLLAFARFYIPGKGFTALIVFGSNHAARYVAEVDPKTTFFTPDSNGYDGQWYAQLAVNPDLRDPRMQSAIDNPTFRARRILFSWTAYLLGLGRPAWVLEAFALQNLLCWLLLGWVLLRWLPPTNWSNVGRWLAVMFSVGMSFSLRFALVDGPALLLVALGMVLLEQRRPWLSALVMGFSGLGKETSLLAGAAPAWPNTRTGKGWGLAILRGALIVAPLACWTTYLVSLFGNEGLDSGTGGFALPFTELWRKTAGHVHALCSSSSRLGYELSGVFTVIALTTQFLFFALRPRLQDPWWRLGAAYAVLMMFLGGLVWDGNPSAAIRVLLPMLLAFNLTVPRSPRWWIVLLLGNLTILSTPRLVGLPAGIDPPYVTGATALRTSPASDQSVQVSFEGGWYPTERSLLNNWRWTSGSAAIIVTNPHAFVIEAGICFGINSREARAIRLLVAGKPHWSGIAGPTRQEVSVAVRLLPGPNRIELLTDQPEAPASGPRSGRAPAFRIHELMIDLRSPILDP